MTTATPTQHRRQTHRHAVGTVRSLVKCTHPFFRTHLGRFLTEDPLGYPDGLNTYAAYHVMRGKSDPRGLSCKDECDHRGDDALAMGVDLKGEYIITSGIMDPSVFDGVPFGFDGDKTFKGTVTKILLSGLPDQTNIFAAFLNEASGRFSGWSVYTRLPYVECECQSCGFLWLGTRLGWSRGKHYQWYKCQYSDIGVPGIFSSKDAAKNYIKKCYLTNINTFFNGDLKLAEPS